MRHPVQSPPPTTTGRRNSRSFTGSRLRETVCLTPPACFSLFTRMHAPAVRGCLGRGSARAPCKRRQRHRLNSSPSKADRCLRATHPPISDHTRLNAKSLINSHCAYTSPGARPLPGPPDTLVGWLEPKYVRQGKFPLLSLQDYVDFGNREGSSLFPMPAALAGPSARRIPHPSPKYRRH